MSEKVPISMLSAPNFPQVVLIDTVNF
jgi:hypothetical protein